VICAAATFGLVAAARFAIAPPAAVVHREALRGAAPDDRAAESLAAMFVRRFLSWDASDPSSFDQAISGFTGSGMEPGVGLELPSSGEESVSWVEVVDTDESTPGVETYTVAAETDQRGLLYLDVPIVHAPQGGLALDGYPAIVGGPKIVPAVEPLTSGEVEDEELNRVIERALRNYLALSPEELAADLANGVRITFPSLRLALVSMQRPYWVSRRAVLAVVQARDASGAQFTLAYRLGVVLQQGRWEVSALESGASA
jgi:hypothetical protein